MSSSQFKVARVGAEDWDKYFVYLENNEKKYFSSFNEMLKWIINNYFNLPTDAEKFVFLDGVLDADLSTFEKAYFIHITGEGTVVATLVKKK